MAGDCSMLVQYMDRRKIAITSQRARWGGGYVWHRAIILRFFFRREQQGAAVVEVVVTPLQLSQIYKPTLEVITCLATLKACFTTRTISNENKAGEESWQTEESNAKYCTRKHIESRSKFCRADHPSCGWILPRSNPGNLIKIAGWDILSSDGSGTMTLWEGYVVEEGL